MRKHPELEPIENPPEIENLFPDVAYTIIESKPITVVEYYSLIAATEETDQ